MRKRSPPLIALGSLALLSCSIQRAGLGEVDGGPVADATPPDGAPDAPVPDAGPGCERFGDRRVVAVVGGGDFGAGVLADTEVEDPGVLALSLSPHRYGALLFTGYDDPVLDPVTPSLDDLAGAVPLERALIDTLWHVGAPRGLGIAALSDFTVEATGEVELEAGNTEIVVVADDRAVVEVTAGGEPRRAVSRGSLSPGTASFSVARAGWYPIRVAWSDDGIAGSVRIEVVHRDAGGVEVSREVIGGDRVRVDLSSLPGREMIGWDWLPADDSPDGARIDRGDTDEDFGSLGYPEGVGIVADSHYLVQWVGRHYLPRGRGTLSADADDRYRLWIDGVFLGEGSSGEYELPLSAGWYDVVYVLEQAGGNVDARLAHDGEVFVAEHMRPRSRFGGRVFGAGWTGPTNVDTGTVAQTVGLVAPGETPTAVEVSAVVETTEPEHVEVIVGTPWGPTPTFALGDLGRSRDDRWHFRAVLRPATGEAWVAGGTWQLEVKNDGSSRAVWHSGGVLAHLGGTRDPYARSGRFESAPLDLGAEHELSAAQIRADRPFGTNVRVLLRAAATAGALAGADFVEADSSGELPRAVRGRFAQVQLALSGPGYDTPRVEDVRIVGAPCEPCEAPVADCLGRSLGGVVALYTFDEGDGRRVLDRSGYGEPLDLWVTEPSDVAWHDGFLAVTGETLLDSEVAAAKVAKACIDTDALTVEAWVRPRNASQDGPARIVSLSVDTSNRSFTLGQTAEDFELRLRTSTGGDGGDPYLEDVGAVALDWMHLVMTWSAGEARLRFYVDGEEVAGLDRDGALDNWDDGYHLMVANEGTLDRPWLGDVGYVAVYDRALGPDEVARNHRAGRD